MLVVASTKVQNFLNWFNMSYYSSKSKQVPFFIVPYTEVLQFGGEDDIAFAAYNPKLNVILVAGDPPEGEDVDLTIIHHLLHEYSHALGNPHEDMANDFADCIIREYHKYMSKIDYSLQLGGSAHGKS